MLQVERSERSRTAILEAALELFSHRGYGATSMRDIAGAAGVSTGSVYHHFTDKEAIFQTLLEQFQVITRRPDFPINLVLESGEFLDDFAALANAAQQVLTRWRPYLALYYVDAVEFDGRHIQRFYADLAARFETIARAWASTHASATTCRPHRPCSLRRGPSSTTSRWSRSSASSSRWAGPRRKPSRSSRASCAAGCCVRRPATLQSANAAGCRARAFRAR